MFLSQQTKPKRCFNTANISITNLNQWHSTAISCQPTFNLNNNKDETDEQAQRPNVIKKNIIKYVKRNKISLKKSPDSFRLHPRHK